VGPRGDDHATALPPSDRIQRDSPRRQVRRQRVHGRGAEARQRGPEDPRVAGSTDLSDDRARAGVHRAFDRGECGD